ncbi:hypothetical protein FACS1894121_0330 [Bacteroidia bacterium]|nr:hypothetical protein FACS1894121_0330 [Bacteroidia bacterium]
MLQLTDKPHKLLLTLLVLCASLSTFGQNNADGGVMLLCRPCQRDSILLRWAPTDKQTWDLGNQYGYVVERYTLLRKDKLPEDRIYQLLTTEPLKPATIAEWERYEDNKYVNIAAECIFGESVTPPLMMPSAIAQKHQEEQNRFSMALFAADQSIVVARLSGLFAVDKTAKVDEKYLYKIYIPAPDSIPIDTAVAFTGLSEYQTLPKPIDFSAHWEAQKVQLSWNIQYLNHIYNSYIVEKSQDGKKYNPIDDNATVQVADEDVRPDYAYRSDSLPDNRSTWYYRVRGVSAFGELGPPSDSIVGHGHIPIVSAPVITNKEVINNKQVRLIWEYPNEMNESITGFRLYRSNKPTGTKDKIYESKSPTERTYIDIHPDITNYYALSVYDDETEKFTAPTYIELIDSTPPLPPLGLAGAIDSMGTVHLSWNKNKEKDINGYRLYRSNHYDLEFILISTFVLTDTIFTDTVNLKTISKQVYYRLKAEDLRMNQSDFSEVLELKRPDITPPLPPVIKSIEDKKNSLVITWINSSSEDAERHHIYRKETADSAFQLLTTVERRTKKQKEKQKERQKNKGKEERLEKQSSYQDNTVQPGENYTYHIQAEDDSGLLSELSPAVQKKGPGEKSDEIVLKKQLDIEVITLNWTVNSKKKVEQILIYKAIGKNAFKIYDDTTAGSYTDKITESGETYHYQIKALYEDGTFSALSNEIKIKM